MIIGPTRYSIPFPRNQYFVGRDTVLQDLKQRLFIQKCQKLALVGLGGVGKTQVALQFAFWVQNNHPEYSIFWLSALSDTTFNYDYLEIGRKAELPMDNKNEEAKMLVKQYLESSRAGKWLVIIDNIDEKTQLATVKNYLPIHDDGLVLFTTRSAEIATSAARADRIELYQMTPKEAIDFLRRSLAHKELIKDEIAAAKLLEELTYLPLAIVQAAAYLNCNPHLTIQRYIDLLHGTDKEIISLMAQEFPDDTRYPDVGNAVATTWIISFTQIWQADLAAYKLLLFLSCVEPKAILQSLLPQMESQQDQESAIGTLVGFAFLARRGNDDVYDMHSLVHLATRIWIGNKGQMKEAILGALEHMEAVFTNKDHTNQQVWRSYFPHSIRLLQQSKDRCIDKRFSLSTHVGMRLSEDRQFKEAIKCLEDVWEWKQKTLREEDQSRLTSEHDLGSAYLNDRRIKEAVEMFEHVVEVQKKTLREEDHSRLTSEHDLGSAYLNDRRIKEVIEIFEHVVEVKKKILREEDHSRLDSEHMLGSAYLDDRRIKEAIEIIEHIVEVQKKTLREEDHSRLNSEHMLGSAYLNDRRIKEAIEIFEHVVEVRKKVLREEDHSRLTSEHELARAYLNDRRIKEAIEILEHVVELEKGLLAEDDPDHLISLDLLEGAYGKLQK
ncbi:P-loop containing nucleoside triphosphate hydrolase protein [Diaporthe sp. PMI_573]|nr:P-loop containing nucleoside triphosphate hydrolase protein [Diaporthaceae sp. PMI_573]